MTNTKDNTSLGNTTLSFRADIAPVDFIKNFTVDLVDYGLDKIEHK